MYVIHLILIVERQIQVDLNGTGDYLSATVNHVPLEKFFLDFWFKTEQNASYLVHLKRNNEQDTERLNIRHEGNTFFVELWKDIM